MRPAYILRDTDVREHAIARIRCLNLNTPEPWALFIAPHKQIRTLEQNALYFALLKKITDATGHHKEALHQYFKKQAFGLRIEQIGEQMVEYIPSSAKVSRGEFSELVEYVQQFIAEHGIEEAA